MTRRPDDRDVRRPYTPARGTELAIPHEVSDEVTGVLQGEDLRIARNKRRTEERLDRVELKQDEDRELDRQRDERLVKVEVGVQQLVDWKIEEREERRLERQFRAQTEAGQVGLAKAKINSRTKIVVGVLGFLGTLAAGILSALAATGKL